MARRIVKQDFEKICCFLLEGELKRSYRPRLPDVERLVRPIQDDPSRLTPRQMDRLLDLGFPFLFKDPAWLHRFRALRIFQRLFGAGRFPKCGTNYHSLARWLQHQKLRPERVSAWRRRLLNDPRRESWEAQLYPLIKTW